MTNIAVFASGRGSNAVNLVKNFNSGSRIHVALCLTDHEDAPVMEKMNELGVPVKYFPRSIWRNEPQEILDYLRQYDIRMIVLAGFLCFVADEIVDAFDGRILNIHPSLLPAYGGKGMHGANIHRAVIEAGDMKSGVTVHVVTKEVDAGPIILQREVELEPGETPESLEAKIHEVEYEVLPEAVVRMVKDLTATDSGAMESITIDSTTPETTAQESTTPPPLPKSVDDAWAEVLGVPNHVPPMPRQTHAYGPQQQPQAHAANTYQAHSDSTPRYAAVAPQSAPEPMPQTYLVWSIVCTILCCFIPGIIAIINSAKVSSKYYEGDIEGARRASRNAEIWIIISFVLGVISSTLMIPIQIAGIL